MSTEIANSSWKQYTQEMAKTRIATLDIITDHMKLKIGIGIDELRDNLDYYAAIYGHVDCLRSAHENGYRWSLRETINAARFGHVDCLEYALLHNFPRDSRIIALAAHNGSIECVKCAHKYGCIINKSACWSAVRNGHLHCLMYIHQNSTNENIWNLPRLRKTAIINNHVHCLVWLHIYMECPLFIINDDNIGLATMIVRKTKNAHYLNNLHKKYVLPDNFDSCWQTVHAHCLEYLQTNKTYNKKLKTNNDKKIETSIKNKNECIGRSI